MLSLTIVLIGNHQAEQKILCILKAIPSLFFEDGGFELLIKKIISLQIFFVCFVSTSVSMSTNFYHCRLSASYAVVGCSMQGASKFIKCTQILLLSYVSLLYHIPTYLFAFARAPFYVVVGRSMQGASNIIKCTQILTYLLICYARATIKNRYMIMYVTTYIHKYIIIFEVPWLYDIFPYSG